MALSVVCSEGSHGICQAVGCHCVCHREAALAAMSGPTLEEWWSATSRADYQAFGPKAEEYGSQDLIDIGREWAQLAGWDNLADHEAEYIGCIFYLRGKIARTMAALGRHELPSHDTDHDMTVYSMMGRKARRNQP